MTERERRAITHVSRCGALSKRELAAKDRISWATAVKVIARLEEAGIVHVVGTNAQPETTGKDPRLYDLADRHPLAVGVDMSPETTTIVLTNLKKAALHHETFPTPKSPTFADLQGVLTERCAQFIEHAASNGERIEGVGVGLPQGFVESRTPACSRLAAALERALRLPVRAAAPAHNYALYAKWAGMAFALDEFILISLRRGIEAGVFLRGDAWRGAAGMAGAFPPETPVSQDALYRHYVRQIRQEPMPEGTPVSEVALRVGLASLFSLAKDEQPEAVALLHHAAEQFGASLAPLLDLLDIPSVIIAADFGADGGVWLPMLSAVMRRSAAGSRCALSYLPLEPLGFAQGAALLILKEFFAALSANDGK